MNEEMQRLTALGTTSKRLFEYNAITCGSPDLAMARPPPCLTAPCYLKVPNGNRSWGKLSHISQ
jgi:hypothetical protein